MQRDAHFQESWRRFIDADAKMDDLVDELAGFVDALPRRRRGQLRELVESMQAQRAIAAEAVQRFCDLATGQRP